MWVYLNNAMLSIVSDLSDRNRLLVRARRKGDIEAVFPHAAVQHTPFNDYAYRASLPRYEVSAAIAERLAAIDYPNFKDSVRDRERHDVYADVWVATRRLSSPDDLFPSAGRAPIASRRPPARDSIADLMKKGLRLSRSGR